MLRNMRKGLCLFLVFIMLFTSVPTLAAALPTDDDIYPENNPLDILDNEAEYETETLSTSPARDFPSMRITSDLHPFRQVREFWHPGFLTIESEHEDWAFEDVLVRLRGRGNSTWFAAPDKRPLRIRFEDPRERHMFGSEHPHRDWILLAHAFDNSLLRTEFAFTLAEQMGTMGFVPSSQFVHLYINNEYVGVYQFTDERDIAPGRGTVVTHADPTISEYWIEMDSRTRDYFSVNGLWYDIRFPSGDALTDAHIAYIEDFVTRISIAIRSGNWENVTALLDIPSIVDYYILQELVKDTDVAFSSMFMQIRGQGENRRLYQGPVWDFDLTMGNVRSNGIDERTDGIWAGRAHYWFRGLMAMPEFRSLVTARWNALIENEIPYAIARVEYLFTHYYDAFLRNFEAQPVLGVRWGTLPSAPRYEITTYAGQVEFLLEWIDERASWLDDYFNTEPPPPFAFRDVRDGAWYHDAVYFVYAHDLMRGSSPVHFSPDGRLTRAMTAAILWRLADEPRMSWSPIFTDVPQNAPDWYITAIMWANETGVVAGDGTRFRPYAHITREEFAAMLHRFTQLILQGDISIADDVSLDEFHDSDRISTWAEEYMLWANYHGLIQGTTQQELRPGNTATRAEAAIILMRFMQQFVFHAR